MTEENKKNVTAAELAEFCRNEAEEKLAENIVMLNVADRTTTADYFILCTANSMPHISAIVNNIERRVREQFAIRPLRTNGDAWSSWILIDFGTVIIHVMSEECREHYNLEKLWSDMPSLDDLENAAIKANLKG
ncbi:MAG: ribosome silencing factor [Lentisphaeria bacterium]|nr:ribosome silencing factor [Lentisphaeria bacterium]